MFPRRSQLCVAVLTWCHAAFLCLSLRSIDNYKPHATKKSKVLVHFLSYYFSSYYLKSWTGTYINRHPVLDHYWIVAFAFAIDLEFEFAYSTFSTPQQRPFLVRTLRCWWKNYTPILTLVMRSSLSYAPISMNRLWLGLPRTSYKRVKRSCDVISVLWCLSLYL